MSEEKETKPETTEEPEKTKKTKVSKKATNTKDTPKDKKKKTTIKKKKSTKKAAGEPGKETKKKTTTKKVVKKSGEETKKKTTTKKATTKKVSKKATTTKPTKKTSTEKKVKKEAPKKEKKEKKKTEKTEVVKVPAKFTKFQNFVAEAIKALSTEDKQWVSYARIKKYLYDFMETGMPQMIKTQTRHALSELTRFKLLKQKKDSYSFTSKGKEKICPEKVPSRKKIRQDPPAKSSKQPEELPPPKEYVSWNGRTCRSVVRV